MTAGYCRNPSPDCRRPAAGVAYSVQTCTKRPGNGPRVRQLLDLTPNLSGSNEVFKGLSGKSLERKEDGVLVERSNWSPGGMTFDVTGDGTSDDVMVFNVGVANEVLVNLAVADSSAWIMSCLHL